MSYELKLTSHFWKKDSNSLFDYDSKDIVTSSMQVDESCFIFQLNKQMEKFKNRIKEKSTDYLASVRKGEGNKDQFKIKIESEYYSQPCDTNIKIASDNWLIVKHTYSKNEEGFKLKEGIIIKLGKVVFKVREVAVGRDDDAEDINKLVHKKVKRLSIGRNKTDNENLNHNMAIDNDNEDEIEENNIFNSNIEDLSNDLSNNVSNYGPRINNRMINSEVVTYSKSMSNNLNFANINSRNGETNFHNLTNKNNIKSAKDMNNVTSTTIINVHASNDKVSKIYAKPKINEKITSTNICRICLGDNSEDFLISICKCTGSVKYIHLMCLRKWLISKISIKTYDHLTIYSYKSLECELCKSNVPELIRIKNKTINLINPNSIAEYSNANKNFPNYIALECLKDKINTNPDDKKTIFILNLKDKTSLKIGRSTDSDVRMTDISVSRQHAVIKVKNGFMYLQDASSKFGTHVNIDLNQEIPLIPNKQFGLQCGRYFITFRLVKTCLAYFCCRKSRNTFTNFEDYNDYFNDYVKSNDKPEGEYNYEEIRDAYLEEESWKYEKGKVCNQNFEDENYEDVVIQSLDSVNNIRVEDISNGFEKKTPKPINIFKKEFRKIENKNLWANSQRFFTQNSLMCKKNESQLRNNKFKLMSKKTFNETEDFTKSKISSYRGNNKQGNYNESEQNLNLENANGGFGNLNLNPVSVVVERDSGNEININNNFIDYNIDLNKSPSFSPRGNCQPVQYTKVSQFVKK